MRYCIFPLFKGFYERYTDCTSEFNLGIYYIIMQKEIEMKEIMDDFFRVLKALFALIGKIFNILGSIFKALK